MKNIIYILSLSILLSFTNVLSARTGNEIFTNYCNTCHSPNMAAMFGAPAAHDKNAWDIRKDLAFKRAMEKGKFNDSDVSVKEKKILEALLITAKEGTAKGMPPKGTCANCTDDELLDAIKYLSTTN
ncbi:MAG: c-type cytochrome [Candidatus Azosocius agrarius]|nr:MAG: c-type cytochrome [Gammaproteobacteria bacterium]